MRASAPSRIGVLGVAMLAVLSVVGVSPSPAPAAGKRQTEGSAEPNPVALGSRCRATDTKNGDGFACRRGRRPVRWLSQPLDEGQASSVPRVAAGSAVEVSQAPWTVAILAQSARGVTACTGSIVADNTVVTAAHCTEGARSMRVEAGRSHLTLTSDPTAVQRRRVRQVRRHPYRERGGEAGDVAVLRIFPRLQLGTPQVQAIALPSAGAPLPEGTAGTLAGFGSQAFTQSASGQLHRFDGTVMQPGCVRKADAVLFCVRSPESSVCLGDSGAGFAVGTPPVLVGVLAGLRGTCTPGGTAVMVRVASPEVLGFIQGAAAPPRGPRAVSAPRMERSGPMRVGTLLTCVRSEWTHAVRYRYAFVDGDGRVLQQGRSRRYRIGPTDVGRRIGCRVTADGPGGTGTQATSIDGAAVTVAPLGAAVQPVVGAPGRRVQAVVELSGLTGRRGEARACVAAIRGVLPATCRTVALPRGDRLRFRLALRVRAGARTGRYRLRVTVVVRPGPTLVTSSRLTVRR